MIRIWPLLLLGCAKEEVNEPLIEGSISVADIGESAEIAWNQAFFVVKDGDVLTFLTGVPGANCADISSFLASSDAVREKEGIYDGGGCVMTVKLENWTGDYAVSWPGEGWSPAVGTSIRCDFGSGAWEVGADGTGREDYYWTGTTWDAQPTVFDWAFSEDGDELELEMNMSAYEGDLTDESTGNLAGTGEVSGVLRAQECSPLQDARIF
jgi:hypothetical protein